MTGAVAGHILREAEIDASLLADECKLGRASWFLTKVRAEGFCLLEVQCQNFGGGSGPGVFRYKLGNFDFTREQFWAILCLLKVRK